MPRGLRRFQESGQSHFVTFSCYRRQLNFVSAAVYDLFARCLEDMRRRFGMRVYGYVVMPEHVSPAAQRAGSGHASRGDSLLEVVVCKTAARPKNWCPRFESWCPRACPELVEGFAPLLG